MTPAPADRLFFGWQVVAAAFVVAAFGWGVGFDGLPVYLYAVHEARGWSIGLVSSAVKTHYLVGAAVVANLPLLHRRFGLGLVTKAGALALGLGIVVWALATRPWELFAGTLLSGGGWAATSAAAINAMVSPWFRARRPAALSLAYNGASVGGIVFSPLWVLAVTALGFPSAAALVGLAMVLTLWVLCDRCLARTPAQMGLAPDGADRTAATPPAPEPTGGSAPRARLGRSGRFLTLAAAMALGLFAQVGLLAHLFSLLLPALGARTAGAALGFATVCAIAGRTLVGWLLPPRANRRTVGAASYGLQACGCAAFLVAGGASVPLLLLGVVLVGAGIGNATSLPPLIAQAEFAEAVVPRVVASITALSQATYAFAPAVFGALRDRSGIAAGLTGAAPGVFAAALAIQLLAAGCYLAGMSAPGRAAGPARAV